MKAYFDSEEAYKRDWSAIGWFRCDKCGGLTVDESSAFFNRPCCLRCDYVSIDFRIGRLEAKLEELERKLVK